MSFLLLLFGVLHQWHKSKVFYVLSRATKGLGSTMVIITRPWGHTVGRGWHSFPGGKTFGNAMGSLRPQRLVCEGLLAKGGPAEPSAAAKLSAMAIFTKLGGCSLLTCPVLSSSEKNKITGMLSSAKIADAHHTSAA